MTTIDAMALLREILQSHTQAEVARRIGKSSAAICSILKGTYPNPGPILDLVVEKYGGLTVNCPALGEISLEECGEHRRRPPTADSYHARMWRACRQCEKEGKK